MPLIQRQVGFAMVEVMVTVAIITIGVSGMGMLLMRAIQGTHDSAQQSQAMWIVQDFIGRMRANPEGARSSMYVLDPSTINCSNKPATMCAETYSGSSKVAAAVCSSAEMATFDNWITTCGLENDIYDSPSDFVVNPELTSTCTNTSTRISTSTGLPDCVQYEVSLTWDTKLTKGSTEEDERVDKNDYSMTVEFN
jgi:type IV pilus modification protein PilV